MPILVQKYGGTSVDGPERIRAVAQRVAAARAAGDDLVVVVSAMGQTTDELLRLAHQVSDDPVPREVDMLLTTGERITMALLAMALHDLSVEAISFTGSQSGILTDRVHRAARIVEVKPDRIRAELDKRRVVIVAGFQGVNAETREITTLGRGGSDTTAIALAAALGARAEICTDVRGVHSADPRVVPNARVLEHLGYPVCSALAHLGGRVLHARCVDLAASRGVPFTVRSSFDESPGTTIGGNGTMETPGVQAIAHRTDCSIVIAEGTSGARGEARGIIAEVADAFPELELTAHQWDSDAHGAIVWIGPRADATALEARFREIRGPGGEWKLAVEHGAAFLSVVGLGLGAREAVRAERALEKASIPLIALRTTPTALILRVPGDRCEETARVLHAEFLEA